jgi:hypothetical protein
VISRLLFVACGFIASLAAAGHASAHVGGTTGYATMAIDGEVVRYSVTLWAAAVPPAIADDVNRALARDTASHDRLARVLAEKMTVLAQGQRCQPSPASRTTRAPGPDRLTLAVDFACPVPVHDLVVRDDVFDVFGTDHHTLARIDAPDHTTQFVFTPDARETRVTLGRPGSGRNALSFMLLGVEHILTGYDHLLFLLALMLPGGGILGLAKIVTAFTAAHSVTLSLAVLDLVTLPDRLIEAVIALSIAAVAVENLFFEPTVRRRWIVSFGFGLVHGFGFSSALRETGLPSHGLLLSLFAFNGGVELGQALVVAVALPAILLMRRRGYDRRIVWGSSLAILGVGLVLFLERALP